MTWKKGQLGEIIATPGQMRRFAVDENFDAVRSDRRNAAYLKPLANPEAEASANVFADVVYSAIAHDHDGFASQEDADWCFEQCLINGRKAECEPEYTKTWAGKIRSSRRDPQSGNCRTETEEDARAATS